MTENLNMLTDFFKKVLLITAITILVAAYSLWSFAWDGFFYQFTALAYVIIFILIKYAIRGDKWFRVIANICFWFSLNNLFDELFFNPKKVGINEYIFAFIIIITSILISEKNGST